MFDLFKKKGKKRKGFKIGKRTVKPYQRNWDVDFFNDIINNEGFVITQPAVISLNGKKEKNMYGPNSPLFGTNYEDEQAFQERYRCKCGEFKGLQFRGETCPLCHTKIESREVDIKKTAWYSLGREKIINPYWYRVLSGLLGKKVFTETIMNQERVDRDGNRHPLIPGKDFDSKNPYACIGIDGFIEKFDEIMDYWAKKKKQKAKEILKCKEYSIKSKIFTSHIPVYSTFLRPKSVTADTFYYNGIDREINPLFKLTESLKDCEPIEKPYYQQRIQEHVNNMWDFNFSLIDGKEGLLRHKLFAGSFNWTSRCVIIPDPTLRSNEVDLSYQAFRILFKYQIINYLMKSRGISLAKAYYQWKRAYKFDPYVYQVMEYIIEKDSPRILLNRNPTLNLYSMLLLRIRHVNPDPYNTTLVVPLGILDGLNADFDGDILNIIAIFEDELIWMFRKFDPIERYIMSRDTEGLHPYYTLKAGQLIDLFHFATFTPDKRLEKPNWKKVISFVKEQWENRKSRKGKKDDNRS